MNLFQRNRLSASITLAVASLGAMSAWAQTEAETSELVLEEVVVTGMRASLAKSLDIKRDSIGVVDAIVAEDIGKFPATNVAEALQRIPGIYLSRDGASNEGNRISIRGLGPQNVVTTINGSLVHTTSSSNVGGSVRDFNYDVFPAELFSAAKVYKTPMAELSEGGIGGAVDLQTPRPFDKPGQQITYSTAASYNDASEQVSPKALLRYSNTWGDFGASVGIAVGNNSNVRSGFQSTGGINIARLGSIKPNYVGQFPFKLDYTDPRANLGNYTQAQLDNAFMQRFFRAYAAENDRDRTAGIFSLQYKNDKLDVSLDGLGSNLVDAADEYTFGVAIRDSGYKAGVKGLVPINVFIDKNNNLQGTFGNASYFAESFIYDSKTQFRNFNLRADYQLFETLKLKAQATTSKSDAVQTNSRIFTQATGVTTTLDSSKNSVYPTISSALSPTITTPTDFTNPASWNVKPDVNYLSNVENDKDDSIKFSAEWNYNLGSWESLLKSGISYVESSKEKNKKEGSAIGKSQALPNGKTFATMTTADFVPLMQTYMPITPYAKDAGEGFPKTWSTFSRDFIENFLQPSLANGNAPLLYPQSFVAEEDIKSIYIQNEMHGDVFARDLKVNLGLRYAETKVISDNYIITKSTVAANGRSAVVEYGPNEEVRDYTSSLPSMNLAYDLTDDVILRASAGKTITRANIVDIASILAIPIPNNLEVNAGNPAMKPQLATNYDFTVDWYPDDTSMLSVGAFRKVIRDERQVAELKVPFRELGLPDTAFAPNNYVDGKMPPEALVTVKTIYNGGEPTVLSGLEFSYQVDFKFLPAPYDGFGAVGSYTMVDKPNAEPWIGDDLVPFETSGTPKNAYSLTGYYEKGGFSSRLTYSHKGKSNNGGDNTNYADLLKWNSSVGYLDATVGYKFTEYLELKLDALNLNNALAYSYFENPRGLYGPGKAHLENARYNGRTFVLGLRGTF